LPERAKRIESGVFCWKGPQKKSLILEWRNGLKIGRPPFFFFEKFFFFVVKNTHSKKKIRSKHGKISAAPEKYFVFFLGRKNLSPVFLDVL